MPGWIPARKEAQTEAHTVCNIGSRKVHVEAGHGWVMALQAL